MDVSDFHLEKALEGYNQTVNELEQEGESPELIEAYVNRGCVLYMMDYLTSAMEDLSTATEMIESLEFKGVSIDDGTFVKAHATIGAILFNQDCEVSEAYSNALLRLDRINPKSRHFDRNGILRMCIDSTENLLDCDYPDDAEHFIKKGLDLTENEPDAWSKNRVVEFRILYGECYQAKDMAEEALQQYSEAFELGSYLQDSSELEDLETVASALISKSECEKDLNMMDLYLGDAEIAVNLLEEMLRYNKLDDPNLIVSIHQDIASVLMSQGRIEEAEKHLMRAVSMGVHGAKEYIRDQTDNSI